MKQTLKYIYSIVFENLKFAETKHTIILTLASAVLAFSTTLFDENKFVNIFILACICFSLVAILYSFVALVARKVRLSHKKAKQKANLLYYKDIMKLDEIEYIECIKKEYEFTNIYKPDAMDYDLAKQIIATSKITYIKFLYFNFAVVFLIMSIFCLLFVVVIKGGL